MFISLTIMQVLWFFQLLLIAPIVLAKLTIFKRPPMTAKVFSSLSSSDGVASGLRHEYLISEVTPSVDIPQKNVSAIKALVVGYNLQLEKNPYMTKMITSAIVGGLGDVLIQLLGNPDSVKELDFRRTSVMMLVGGLYVAPLMHNWFNLLSKMPLPQLMSPFGISSYIVIILLISYVGKALLMMITDQTVGAPMVISGFFMAHEIVGTCCY